MSDTIFERALEIGESLVDSYLLESEGGQVFDVQGFVTSLGAEMESDSLVWLHLGNDFHLDDWESFAWLVWAEMCNRDGGNPSSSEFFRGGRIL